MRLPAISIRRLTSTISISRKSYSTMSVSEFVAAAEKSDASLKGSSEKDQQAIQKLTTETEGMAKDTTVSFSLGPS